MSLPPVLGAPLRRDNHFEHSYFYLKNISTGFSANIAGFRSCGKPSFGGAGAKLRRGDPGIHAATLAKECSGSG